MRRRSLSLAVAAALTIGVAAPAPAALAAPRPAPSAPPASASSIASMLPGFDELKPSATPAALTEAPRDLDVTYTVNGQTRTLKDFLNRSAQGFVVLDGSKIVKEWYAAGYSKNSLFQSWSMAKSYTSDVIGIALAEGKIGSLDDTVAEYLPELAKSGYGDVSLRNLLRMSSGIEWNEPVDDVPLHVSVSMGWASTLQLASYRKRGWEPGSRFNYTSMNSAVLALVLQKATGVPYYKYVQDKIWGPAGMASTAYVGNDGHGDGLGYCCVYANDRDFARFGKMMLNGGKVDGRQVVPASWIEQATAPSPANPGYGLHWWLDGSNGYYASGLGGQSIYVSTKHDVVIVKSTFLNLDESETLPAFRAVAAEVARTR
ncbi:MULTISPECIES: serine hydrolase domain-containing protein [Actinomadura]|uniref:Serine hydrolase domain-containing protein n=1 Tax=Actinomadura yumaensis TaxID=111807 RepID=A0ABW2CAR4_9ACTN|nr:serine hydrolase [Actinomadura sp. J1-007]MWK33713.1 serine hydrolase [Actinomadura sp. J1-007]